MLGKHAVYVGFLRQIRGNFQTRNIPVHNYVITIKAMENIFVIYAPIDILILHNHEFQPG